jgi:inner membrane protein
MAGLAIGALIAPHPATIGIAALFALLPDIDHPQAIITGWIPGGRLVGLLVGHRGPTHSLLALLTIAALLTTLGAPLLWVAAAVAGYGSHIILDALTMRGVPLLWPLPWHVRVPLLWLLGGLLEFLVMIAALGALAWAALIT